MPSNPIEYGTVVIDGQPRDACRFRGGVDYRERIGFWRVATPNVASTFVSMDVTR